MIFSLIFLWLTEREESIKSVELYIASLISLILLSNICEMIIYQNFRDSELVFLFDIELISILFLFTALYFILQKNFKADYIIYIHSLIAILASHIFIAGVIGILLVVKVGSLIIALIHELNNIKWNNKIQLRRELKQKGLIKRSINEYFKIPTKYEQKTLF